MAIGFNSMRASDSWRRCRKRNYAMSIKRLFDAVERRGDIGRRVAALVLPISNRPRVTSSCASQIGLREPGEHTSGPNLASRDNVAHNQTLYDSANAATGHPALSKAGPDIRYQMGQILSFAISRLTHVRFTPESGHSPTRPAFDAKADECTAAKTRCAATPC